MIDIEIQVYNVVRNCILTKYPNINVVADYVVGDIQFPTVSVIELDNKTFERTIASEQEENHSEIMYQIDIYANGDGKRLICKDIRNIIDKELISLGFTRLMSEQLPNIENTNVYRIVSRYVAIVSKDNYIYRK